MVGGKLIEAKAKGDACNRCRVRRVRCTGVDGKPCAACLRTAKFRGHDLDQVYCGYHGAGRCSEEQDDLDKPRKKRIRARAGSASGSSSSLSSAASTTRLAATAAAHVHMASGSSRPSGKKRAPVPAPAPVPRLISAAPVAAAQVAASTSSSNVSPPLVPVCFEDDDASTALLASFAALPDPFNLSVQPSTSSSSTRTTGDGAAPLGRSPGSANMVPISDISSSSRSHLPFSLPALATPILEPLPVFPIQLERWNLDALVLSIHEFSSPNAFQPLSPASSSGSSPFSTSPTSTYAHSTCSSPPDELLSTPKMPQLVSLGEALLFAPMPTTLAQHQLNPIEFSGYSTAFPMSTSAGPTTPYWYGDEDCFDAQYFATAWSSLSPSQKSSPCDLPMAAPPSLFGSNTVPGWL